VGAVTVNAPLRPFNPGVELARFVTPLTRGGRAEANLVGAATVPEAGHRHALFALAEGGGPLNVEMGIPRGGTGGGDFEGAPAFDEEAA
jgi:hypothetical protein